MREILLCRKSVSDIHGEGNNYVYGAVCLKYREREMIMCAVICVCGKGRGKC